jgi:hypothetical protein
MTARGFQAVLEALARAWTGRRYDDAVGFSAADVCYLDPVRYDLRGRDQLLAFFRDDGGYDQATVWWQVFFAKAPSGRRWSIRIGVAVG